MKSEKSEPLPAVTNMGSSLKLDTWKMGFNLWSLVLFACFFLLILFSARKIESYDLGTHLKAGSWIVQNHAYPSKDTFTYTQNDQNYLDSNGLYQILLYTLQSALGYPALTLMNITLLFLVFLVLFWRLRLTETSSFWICLLLLASILATERRFFVRPEVFSWLFLGLTLYLLELREKNRNYLYLLPIIQWFWVNTEGLFVLGWAVLFAYGISGYIQRKKIDKSLVRFGLFSIATDFLNPYFFKGVVFPFELWTRLQASDLHKQNITELLSPFQFLTERKLHYDASLHLFIFFFLVLAFIPSALWTWRKRKFHEIVLPAAFGYLAFGAVRNIPLFILVSAPYMGAVIRDLFQNKTEPFLKRKIVPLAFLVLLTLFIARVATNAYYISDRRIDRLGLGLGDTCLPVGAVRFMRENHLDGRLLNSIDCGGWVDWQAPQPSFIDGRSEVMEDRFYEDYLESLKPGGLYPLLARYQPQLVLVDYNADSSWSNQLKDSPDWRLICLDDCSALYAANGYAPQFKAVDFSNLPIALGIPWLPDDEMTAVMDQLKPNRSAAWIAGFYKPQSYPLGLSGLGLFTMKYGQYFLARLLFLHCLQEAPGKYEEFYFNLAVSNLHLGNFSLGRICLQDTLQLDPGNIEANRMISHFSN